MVDHEAVRIAHDWVRNAVRSGALHSAHDVAEGGLAVALAECCVAGGTGASVEPPEGLELFGEAPGSGFVVSGPEAALAGFDVIGYVGGSELEIAGCLEVAVSELEEAREHRLDEFV